MQVRLVLELGVDFARMERTGGFFGRGAPQTPPTPVKAQELSQVEGGWPAGRVDARIGDFMARPHQKVDHLPVPDAGGYPGSAYFKIVIEATSRALAATAGQEVGPSRLAVDCPRNVPLFAPN